MLLQHAVKTKWPAAVRYPRHLHKASRDQTREREPRQINPRDLYALLTPETRPWNGRKDAREKRPRWIRSEKFPIAYRSTFPGTPYAVSLSITVPYRCQGTRTHYPYLYDPTFPGCRDRTDSEIRAGNGEIRRIEENREESGIGAREKIHL